MPKHVAPPLLCRYEPGMKYGAHADAALLPARQCAPALRPFVHGLRQRSRRPTKAASCRSRSATWRFRSRAPPATRSSTRRRRCTRSFRCAPGERLVSITFIESYIADEHQRTQVYELNEIAALEGTLDEMGKPRAPRRRAAEPDAHVVDDLGGRRADLGDRGIRSRQTLEPLRGPCGSRRDGRGATRAGPRARTSGE